MCGTQIIPFFGIEQSFIREQKRHNLILITRYAELAVPWFYSVAFGNTKPVAEGDRIALRN